MTCAVTLDSKSRSSEWALCSSSPPFWLFTQRSDPAPSFSKPRTGIQAGFDSLNGKIRISFTAFTSLRAYSATPPSPEGLFNQQQYLAIWKIFVACQQKSSFCSRYSLQGWIKIWKNDIYINFVLELVGSSKLFWYVRHQISPVVICRSFCCIHSETGFQRPGHS